MSISTHPGIRGITATSPSSIGGEVATDLRDRLDWLAGLRRGAGERPPRESDSDSCREVVDTRSGVPRDTLNADSITNSAGRVGGRLSRLFTMAGARLHFNQRTRGMLALLMLFIAAIAAAAAWYFWPRPEPLPTAVPVSQNEDESTREEQEVLVSVAGDVTEPGLVEVTAGARVADAIEAAGGLSSDVESAGYLNLARKVTDGEMIVVEGDSEEPTVPSQAKSPDDDAPSAAADDDAADSPDPDGSAGSDAPVNLNDATADQLDDLPGVGPVMAQRIIDYRKQNGGFDSVDQLGDVDGIGPATLDKLSKLVNV